MWRQETLATFQLSRSHVLFNTFCSVWWSYGCVNEPSTDPVWIPASARRFLRLHLLITLFLPIIPVRVTSLVSLARKLRPSLPKEPSGPQNKLHRETPRIPRRWSPQLAPLDMEEQWLYPALPTERLTLSLGESPASEVLGGFPSLKDSKTWDEVRKSSPLFVILPCSFSHLQCHCFVTKLSFRLDVQWEFLSCLSN